MAADATATSWSSAMPSLNVFDRLWMPFTYYQDTVDFPPVVIKRGSGIYVYDTSGRELIDGVGSWWVSSFGHCHPYISAAIKKQLDDIEHILMAGFVNEPALRLSHLLGDLLLPGLSRMFYSDDGSTAVEVALKIALQYHAIRKSKASEFVGLGGGYHGDTLGAMSVSNIPAYHSLFHERFKKHHSVDSPHCFRCPKGKEQQTCNAECMDSLAAIFEKRRDKIAACIFEPMVQGAAGMRVYPAKVLKRIFSLCEKYKILTIADEVATGFGRTGKLFACEYAEKPAAICQWASLRCRSISLKSSREISVQRGFFSTATPLPAILWPQAPRARPWSSSGSLTFPRHSRLSSPVSEQDLTDSANTKLSAMSVQSA
jgi:adenosylmethionine---8-amino-7-oxononanoate aminotransferase